MNEQLLKVLASKGKSHFQNYKNKNVRAYFNNNNNNNNNYNNNNNNQLYLKIVNT